MRTQITGFTVERWRKQLLADGKTAQLLQTYSTNFPEILGENTPDFWDQKFTGDLTTLFAMAYYRNKTVAGSLPAQSTVLNIGAGKGYLERFVQQRNVGIKVTGTDFTNRTIEQLRAEFPEFEFVQTSIVPLPFADESFDCVCLLEVLEHIAPSETFAVLQELTRVLKKGGTAVISVPLNEGLEQMMPSNPNAHKRVYSPALVQFELEQVGLHVKQKLELSAFGRLYVLKHWINTFFRLRHPNNIVFWVTK